MGSEVRLPSLNYLLHHLLVGSLQPINPAMCQFSDLQNRHNYCNYFIEVYFCVCKYEIVKLKCFEQCLAYSRQFSAIKILTINGL